jgi:formamidopyrimidine-DNA glycosylase
VPELPDVEVFKRYLDSTSLHQKIGSVEVKNKKILGEVPANKLRETLEGQELESTHRHGKHLFVQLDNDDWLMLHFGMTGWLKYFKDPKDEPSHARLLITFENGYHLAFDCQRMLGEVDLIEDPEEFIEDKRLGPDLLELDFPSFRKRFGGRKGTIKSALMNQQIIAGIGNIYSDEILFQARVHPGTGVDWLDEEVLKKLFEETQRVLRTAIEHQADPEKLPDSFLLPLRRKGEKCPRGNGMIERIKATGRTAYFCPACQSQS